MYRTTSYLFPHKVPSYLTSTNREWRPESFSLTACLQPRQTFKWIFRNMKRATTKLLGRIFFSYHFLASQLLKTYFVPFSLLANQVVAAELLEVSLPTAKSEDCKQNSYIVQEDESGMDSSSVWQVGHSNKYCCLRTENCLSSLTIRRSSPFQTQ